MNDTDRSSDARAKWKIRYVNFLLQFSYEKKLVHAVSPPLLPPDKTSHFRDTRRYEFSKYLFIRLEWNYSTRPVDSGIDRVSEQVAIDTISSKHTGPA